MEFTIVNNNIAMMHASAIVLPANSMLIEGAGASTAIFEAAGREKLTRACYKIYDEYQRQGKKIKIGTAIATPAYNLDADYIIHTIVPRWIDGYHDEAILLQNAYKAALELADSMECSSIAFPLLASGNNGFDIELAYHIARSSIKGYKTAMFLKTVFLVAYNSRIEYKLRELETNSYDDPTDKFYPSDDSINKYYPSKQSVKNELLTFSLPKQGRNKQIHVMTGDICDINDTIDLLACSAYKQNYYPLPGTLLGSLYKKKGISVQELSWDPDIDMRDMGCWLSKETGTCFRRIACVELLPVPSEQKGNEPIEKMLTSTFSSLRFICEQANIRGIPLQKIALPILGTGHQKIDINYVAPVLLSQMQQSLELIDQLTDIYIYELNPKKASHFSEILSNIHESIEDDAPGVFISYSSKQDALAHQIYKMLVHNGITCWIAPENIPPGSSYIEEIAEGIGSTKITVLVLTPDAERSPWVRKEIGTSIGSGHILIPFQKDPYEIGKDFRFLLDGEQILEAWKYSEDSLSILLKHVTKRLS